MMHTMWADYGITGLFIAYLIYDRTIILNKLIKAIDRLAEKVR